MNLRQRLIHLADKSEADRDTGRTTLLAKATKELNGLLIAENFGMATFLQRKYGVASRAMELNLDGYSGPIFFDHHAIESILRKAANKISELELENVWLKEQLEKSKT